ncbi:MAG TPA: hypothetical protein ENK80_03030 [Rhodobacterales bacterium]|nr:hypothetical protein [Rhodobacterales bacterium]
MADDSSEYQDETEALEAEVVEEAEADPDATDPSAFDSPLTTPRRGISVAAGLVLGGVLAAVLGFTAARTIVPEGWPFPGVTPEPDPLALALDAQKTTLADLADRFAALGARVDGLEADTGVTDLRQQLEDAQARITRLSEVINNLDARLLEVEKIPRGSGTEAAEAAARAYERELAAMRSMLDGELAQIRATQEAANADSQSAEAAAREAAMRAALAQVTAALDNGQPFGAALATLAEISGHSPSSTLASAAKAGIPTLTQLQSAFPEAARAALSASITELVAAGKIGRFEGFMRSQLGTRSLEPKEGDDPDAVLSRAEAALKSGDIAAALAEIGHLPEAGQSEMANWVALATSRAQAVADVQAMTAELNTQ